MALLKIKYAWSGKKSWSTPTARRAPRVLLISEQHFGFLSSWVLLALLFVFFGEQEVTEQVLPDDISILGASESVLDFAV